MIKKNLLIALALFSGFLTSAQQKIVKEDSIKNFSAYKRSVSFSGLFQPRYTVSLTPNVDVNGTHFDTASKAVNSSFSLRRVRFQVKTQVNDHFDANLLVNFAEFTGNPTGKVLENAYVRYTMNDHFHLIMGQFRPFIGIEDVLPADFISSLDFSNGYYSFGRNGWQSFQAGLAVYGDITKKLRYYAGVNNGNGRNQTSDNDNTKHYYARMEADIAKGVTIGANAGAGGYKDTKGNIYSMDMKSEFELGGRWRLNLNMVYKNGTNFSYFDTIKVKPSVKDVRIANFYAIPVLKYQCNLPRLRSVEFSNRYEYLVESNHYNKNPRQTYTPMLGLEFADKYFACFQVGAIIDAYKYDIPKTSIYSHNTMVAQLQLRF